MRQEELGKDRAPIEPNQAASGELLGDSRAFRQTKERALEFAQYDVNIILEGETGTGKELFARMIHAGSHRHKGPVVSINCGAIPQELAESELFGHTRGAFTDARESRPGLVSQAHRGTLFLDELTSMSSEIQAKLLRFLQSGEFRAVGSTQTGASDVRVVSACNTPLVLEAREGRFRWDLFYRLGVITLHIPPLRERQEDVPLLLEHFLHHYAAKFGLRPARLSPRGLAALMDYPWPGNVRELQNMAQLLSIRCADSWVELTDLPLMNGQEAPVLRRPAGRKPTGSYQEERERVLKSFEKTYLVRLLRKHDGNVSAAAREAGKDRRTLTRLLRKHDIDADRFRPGRC